MRQKMLFNGIGNQAEFVEGVSMTDMLTSILPNMLLGIGVGCASRKPHDFQSGIGLQECFHRVASVMRGAIPKYQDGLVRVSVQYVLEIQRCCIAVHDLTAHDDFLAREQIQ